MTPAYTAMLLFDPTKLIEIYFDTYIQLYGELKANEIIEKINNSEKANEYLKSLQASGRVPNAVDIGSLIMSIRSFFLAKPETICSGGLFLLMKLNLKRKYNADETDYDPEYISHICADYIIYCSKMKFKHSHNFFTVLFNKIESESQTFKSCKCYVVKKVADVNHKNYDLNCYTLKRLGQDKTNVFHYSYFDFEVHSYVCFENSEFYEEECLGENGRTNIYLKKQLILSGTQEFRVVKVWGSITKGDKTLIRISPKDYYTSDKYVVFYDVNLLEEDGLTLDLSLFDIRDKYLNGRKKTTGEPIRTLFKELYQQIDS